MEKDSRRGRAKKSAGKPVAARDVTATKKTSKPREAVHSEGAAGTSADVLRQQAVRDQVEKLLPELTTTPLQDLQIEVETIPWTTEPTTYGLTNFLRIERFRPNICPHTESIQQGLQIADAITYVTLVLIPVFPASIPVKIVIKVATVVVRVGVSRYCGGWKPVR